MQSRLLRVFAAIIIASLSGTLVSAQGTATASLSGVAVDSAGGVIPGATVVVTNKANGTKFNAVTNSTGAFSVPALDAGTYSVTVSLMGFKTAVIDEVKLQPGTPASVKAMLEVGSLSETVVVQGSSDLVNTQTATVSSTLNVDQINKMPLASRNAINAVTFLTGVNTAGANRDSNFNGLPDSFVAISLDGVNNNENFNKSTEGLFAMVTPRQDAVEAVTVTTAVGGADVGGHGAVQISFVTRSGTNTFSGSAYEYHREPSLNTNYWFNKRNGLPRNDVVLNQYGARQGGPITIPGLYDGRNKAFFFFNYEELRLPNNFTRTRNVLAPSAQAGLFRWTAGSATREVNLLALAAQNGQTATLDPMVQKVLGYINGGVQKSGTLSPQTGEPNLMDYTWQSPGNQIEKQPVVRLDYNLTEKHRLSGTYNWQVVIRDPDQLNGGDARFPGSPNFSKYVSYRPLSSGSLRSTLSANLVNELRGGVRWGPGYFGQPESNGPQTYQDQNGLALNITNSDANADGLNLTNWHTQNGPTSRSAWSWNVDNTLSWQKAKHSVSFGTSLFFGHVWEDGQQMVPGITLGVDTNDPANAMFTNANFPGASSAQLVDAREIYALLTGRVISVTGQAALDANTNTYSFLGKRRRAGRMNEYSAYAQDSWRVSPTLTLSGGLRWDIQMPFTPVNDIMSQATVADACGISGIAANGECNFFKPGASGGKVPNFVQFSTDTPGYHTDWNNVAPNLGMAWRPNVQRGFMRSVLGDPEQATFRAGYAVAYDRQGMAVFTGQYGGNPGSTLSLTRSGSNGLLVPAGQTFPVLLSQTDRLYAAPFSETPTFPIPVRANRADNVNIFHPDIEIASARSWNVSWQRALTKNTAFEVRYVGTRGVNQWTNENYNDTDRRNIIENGFFDEFKLAMANLKANNASGIASRSGSFAYFGAGSGTNPLPIYLAYFNASRDVSNAAAYSGTNWTNTTFAGRLSAANPLPYSAASDLDGNSTRRNNAIATGLARNLFVVNPDVTDVNVYVSKAYSNYNALQIELRRRLSRGFQINGSYQYALEGGSSFLGYRYGRVLNPTANVRHAIKTQWNYNIPVGRGQRFGENLNPVLNGILGGWEFDGVGRIQARTLNFGNVRLVGMTVGELTDMYKIRIEADPATSLQNVYMLPADVILNTRRAFSVSTTSANGYSDLGVPEGRYIAPANGADCIQLETGDCAPRTLLVRAPFFTRFDVGLTKRFPIRGRTNFELRFDVLNVLDNINFNPAANPGSGATIFQVTSAYTDASNTFDPGGRLGMLVFRLNW
jgi:hypothetical protein